MTATQGYHNKLRYFFNFCHQSRISSSSSSWSHKHL